ncbi:two-component system sensor histidine kinase NtrB [Pseudobdellovibrio sp. HCB154]|uniref:two-component system sensor histidine kinase NtrB n=1 Tax=Pseudobdellovibrio sp. HCB154 TaxID=3386277 RepID=UPI0039173761
MFNNAKIEQHFTSLSARDWRAVVLFFYSVLFQLAILSQTPFIQVNFLIHFYGAVLLFFAHHLLLYFTNSKNHVLSFMFDFVILFYLMAQHSVLSSFNLIVLLILLFIAGSELSKTSSLVLTMFSSVCLSFVNLLSIRWEGIQNLFTLVLFNFSFVTVSIISQQFRVQLKDLHSELTTVTKKLRSREEFSEVLIQQMPTGLTAFNQSHDLLFANKNLTDRLNLSVNDLRTIFSQTNTRGQAEFAYYNPQLQEKKIYEVNQASYEDVYLNETVNLMMLKDVTEVKHLQDQMRQREKLAAIGQLAAGIAHEIRNPLAGISGSIQLLSTDAKNPDDQKLMKIILKEIDRLNNLITEFLDYSKPEQRPDQKIDLALVMNDVIQNIKASPQTPKNLNLEIQVNSAMILGYADKLKQAFLNISMNAVQAMLNNENPKLVIKLETFGDEVMLSIKDNGSGMPEEVKKRIFEPFFTTKPKGTGLGLAITHKVLESHQAQMQIHSEMGVGTEFILKFKKA